MDQSRTTYLFEMLSVRTIERGCTIAEAYEAAQKLARLAPVICAHMHSVENCFNALAVHLPTRSLGSCSNVIAAIADLRNIQIWLPKLNKENERKSEVIFLFGHHLDVYPANAIILGDAEQLAVSRQRYVESFGKNTHSIEPRLHDA
jgi:hypothetical protein